MSFKNIEMCLQQIDNELRKGSMSEFEVRAQWLYRPLSIAEAEHHLGTMHNAAKLVKVLTGDPTGLLETVKQLNLIMWDGATGYLAIGKDTQSGVFLFDFESVPSLVRISESFERFLQHIRAAIAKNEQPNWMELR